MDARDAAEHADAAFAVVFDVAATWHGYCRMRPDDADRDVPGLIVHAAGPTSEGVRTIDVWHLVPPQDLPPGSDQLAFGWSRAVRHVLRQMRTYGATR
jgi:hypothetical protein